MQSRLYDRDRDDWKWIVSDMDFRSPDYEPLDGFVAFNLPIKNTRDSFYDKEAFLGKIYSDVSLFYFGCGFYNISILYAHCCV